MDESSIRRIFTISLLLKGAHAVVECIGGVLLAVVSTGAITALVNDLTQEELIEDPHDFVATHLSVMAQGFTGDTQRFYALYLFSHGFVKIFLVAGLLARRLWAYPVAIVVLGLFIAYQLYRFSYTNGIGLLVLTVFDLVVIGLTWHEWRVIRTLR